MNSHLHLLISTVESSELNNAEDYDNDPLEYPTLSKYQKEEIR